MAGTFTSSRVYGLKTLPVNGGWTFKMRIRLNQHMVDRPPAPPPGKRQHLIWDTAHRYFGLCVSRTGVKSFIFQKKRRIVIGHYPAMSLTAALTEYRRLLGEIARGADPAADRAARRAENHTGRIHRGVRRVHDQEEA